MAVLHKISFDRGYGNTTLATVSDLFLSPSIRFPMFSMRSLYAVALLSLLALCKATDTITPTHPISDGKHEAVVSSGGSYKLGFFSPGNSRYVGIWFNKVSLQTEVWVANREAPIIDSTGALKIADDGNLVVFSGNSKLPLWSTNVSMPSSNSTAKLLPSGNLVLVVRNMSNNSESISWQSFHHPTDTILPGMKFGFDRRTGRNTVLTSWQSNEDPAAGQFSIYLDPRGSPEFFLYKDSDPY